MKHINRDTQENTNTTTNKNNHGSSHKRVTQPDAKPRKTMTASASAGAVAEAAAAAAEEEDAGTLCSRCDLRFPKLKVRPGIVPHEMICMHCMYILCRRICPCGRAFRLPVSQLRSGGPVAKHCGTCELRAERDDLVRQNGPHRSDPSAVELKKTGSPCTTKAVVRARTASAAAVRRVSAGDPAAAADGAHSTAAVRAGITQAEQATVAAVAAAAAAAAAAAQARSPFEDVRDGARSQHPLKGVKRRAPACEAGSPAAKRPCPIQEPEPHEDTDTHSVGDSTGAMSKKKAVKSADTGPHTGVDAAARATAAQANAASPRSEPPRSDGGEEGGVATGASSATRLIGLAAQQGLEKFRRLRKQELDARREELCKKLKRARVREAYFKRRAQQLRNEVTILGDVMARHDQKVVDLHVNVRRAIATVTMHDAATGAD